MTLPSRSYDWVPFRIIVPAEPTLEDRPLDPVQIGARGEIPITGLTTVPFTTEAAIREADDMLRRCRESLRRGNRYALAELLDANPAFIAVPWVAEQLLRLRRGGLPLRRRGRVRGAYRFHPLVVAGLVRHLIARGETPNPDRAFHHLATLGLMPYETAKDLYYRARRNDRFKAILMEFPGRSVRRSAPETAALLNGVRVLQPGGRATWTADDPVVGASDITIECE
jgi:hypothetical protein